MRLHPHVISPAMLCTRYTAAEKPRSRPEVGIVKGLISTPLSYIGTVYGVGKDRDGAAVGWDRYTALCSLVLQRALRVSGQYVDAWGHSGVWASTSIGD